MKTKVCRKHTTNKEILKIYDVNNKSNNGIKPKGLWYAIDDSWIEWCNSENFHTSSLKISYKLELDQKKILILNNEKKIKSFVEKYGEKMFLELDFDFLFNKTINWDKVSQDFYGIEINPYNYKFRHSLLFYNAWDVASGCIWNKKAIKKFEKL